MSGACYYHRTRPPAYGPSHCPCSGLRLEDAGRAGARLSSEKRQERGELRRRGEAMRLGGRAATDEEGVVAAIAASAAMTAAAAVATAVNLRVMPHSALPACDPSAPLYRAPLTMRAEQERECGEKSGSMHGKGQSKGRDKIGIHPVGTGKGCVFYSP